MLSVKHNIRRATTTEFQVIQQETLDAGFSGRVHVEGWAKGCVFLYLGTIEGVHHLRTLATGREYQTKSNLLYTRNNQPT